MSIASVQRMWEYLLEVLKMWNNLISNIFNSFLIEDVV
jgi:hypothetical protein